MINESNARVCDTETTTANSGHVYNPTNKLCYVGLYDGQLGSGAESAILYDIDLGVQPYGAAVESVRAAVLARQFLVAFQAKFDINWLRRYNVLLAKDQLLWDLQLSHFILRGQSARYPSLNEVAAYYGLPQKIDVVKEEYWAKGIDTPDIPKPVMHEYLRQDCWLEWQVLLHQIEEIRRNPSIYKLILLSCQDVLNTAEMEWNGLKYDIELSKALGKTLENRIKEINSTLRVLVGADCSINFSSPDQLSAVLFGGTIKTDIQEQYEFQYKDGRTRIKDRWVVRETVLPRLVEPLKGTETKKSTDENKIYQTNGKVLSMLKATGKAKRIIELITELGQLDQRLSTFYYGLPAKFEEFKWKDSVIHGQLNHCVTGTGRLSSSKPNQQNLEEGVRECVISRFPKRQ